ncbi:MAG TPA: MtnX-like HAD-IB family phosphatase [Anaeromyxobacteraceae bacterium]|nr:MtnX-like HAD-IB family phosphatase [Anaeromyxobacteraceae bacterium]
MADAERWAVVCDFDGTATTRDIGDAVAIRFAGEAAWRAAEDRYAAGEISFAELLAAIFAPVRASREEIAAFARAEAVLRDGFEDLVASCRRQGRPFLVVSAGLDLYIEAVLERLSPELRGHVQLRCNRGAPSPDGLAVAFHGDGDGCGRCGFCKGTVVAGLVAAGYRVAVCGDGFADRCAAEKAHLVFARGRLPGYLDAAGVPYRRFETFHEVLAALPA